ncbi:2-oxoglutarate synthase subunit KorA [Candidatus Anstonella stagnisolia]|nr:2-oxoglutarate synthase subunit KorA [Candidatus Anstonella stagnisolia]
MQENEFTLKVGGEAGSGVMTIGLMLGKCLQHLGLNVFGENDYPSLIRGGHNTFAVRASAQKIYALDGGISVLIALNDETITLHAGEVAQDGAIIYDSEKTKVDVSKLRKDVKYVPIPMYSCAQKTGGEVFLNTVAVGAALSLLGVDFVVLEDVLKKLFSKKGDDIIKKNISAGRCGFDNARDSKAQIPFLAKRLPSKNQILLNGNEAICIGALKGGCKFVAEYPMSPSSSVLHYMAAHEREYKMVVKHAEDEIAAANMLCGAAFTGCRAMTATSGGGFSLMTEALGLAGLSEQPVLIVDVMRPGPSTCMPTYTEQADLQFALHASQGEFPRLVFCPGDIDECFFGAIDMLNWAEIAQTPAIMLSDKHLAEQIVTTGRFDDSKVKILRGKIMQDSQMQNAENFKRHELASDGISPRCFPGQPNGLHVASSYEHDETGFTSERAQDRTNQVDKRARKLANIPRSLIAPKIYGDADAKAAIVFWGSTKGAALEALKVLRKEGKKLKAIQILWASPFPDKEVKAALNGIEKCMVIELNSTGQMHNLIREKTGILIEHTYLKYDGRPFIVSDVVGRIKKMAGWQ